MTGRRRVSLLAAGLSTALLGAAALIAPAEAAGQPPLPATRLEGTFRMSGKVTAAHYVRGEHVGELVQRTWTFTPLCASGPCARVHLGRGRATGTDSLELTAVAANVYVGRGRFYAPMRCAGRIYRLGEAVPFKIRVSVTATEPTPAGGTTATAITARYVNRTRINRTPCVAARAHDAARYAGTLLAG